MFIPLRAEAEVYYRGVGTVALIAVTTLLFFVSDPEGHPGLWALQFGTFLPWQWVTYAFSHGGIPHLLGNMVFLFWFGQIVEGRLGWRKFVPLYLGLAAAEGLIVQVLMLRADGGVPGAIGSSGAIYGLMVIALFWAPKTRFSCLLFLYPILMRTVEISLGVLCGIYLLFELLIAHVFGFRMGTPVLHLIGAAIGLLPAIYLPRTGWVYLGDWEGLLDPLKDLRPEKPPVIAEDPAVVRERKRVTFEREIEGHLAARDGAAAAALHARGAAVLGGWDLPPVLERNLIRCLIGQGRHVDALDRIRRYLERGLPDAETLRIAQAEMLAGPLDRPRQALSALAAVDRNLLTPELEEQYARVEARARTTLTEGDLELE